MSTISDPDLFGGHRQPHPEHLHCNRCGAGRHLMIHSIDPLPSPAQGLVTGTYTCEGCGRLHTQQASVPQVAAILNRPGPSAAADVLQFGGQCIHCGEPMHSAGTELCSVYSPVTTETPAASLLEVYLSARVLRCDVASRWKYPIKIRNGTTLPFRHRGPKRPIPIQAPTTKGEGNDHCTRDHDRRS
jgi:hypothetical protein